MTKRSRSFPTELPVDSVDAIKRFAMYPRPKLYKLQPPATEAEVCAREEKLGYRLPPELRSVLLVHNGLTELQHNTFDLLGGTGSFVKLRRAFLHEWKDLVGQFEYGPPLQFGKRYLVIGACFPLRNEFILLDRKRLLDGMHPVARFKVTEGYEVQGFRSLTHYLHWFFIEMNDQWTDSRFDMFPERYNAFKFRKMMKAAVKVP